MNYQIILAQKEHLPQLPEIEKAAAFLFSDEDVPPANKEKATPSHTLEEAQEQGRLWVVLEERTDHVVGFAYATDEKDSLHPNEISMHPDHGQKGLGTRLMKEIIQWAKDRAYQSITLTTFIHLPWNAPFYQKLGFKILGESELNPRLKKILAKEAEGIDISKRIVMNLDL